MIIFVPITTYIELFIMKDILDNLSKHLASFDAKASHFVCKLAARYEKSDVYTPKELQPAYKYIMYLKIMKGLDDETFHHMKRKYMDTSSKLQAEFTKELDKIISNDALNGEASSAEIRKEFLERLSMEEDIYRNDTAL